METKTGAPLCKAAGALLLIKKGGVAFRKKVGKGGRGRAPRLRICSLI